MKKRLKIGVLISGNGTNLQAIIDASKNNCYPAKIVIVIANRADAYGLKRAEHAKIQTKVIDHKSFDSRESFDNSINTTLKEVHCDIICLAGFMRILSASFIKKWPMKIINIHPSLLPSFIGMNVHKQVIESGVRISGCTVHFVTNQLDSGPIIAQVAVPVLRNDNPKQLAARVLQQENKIYPLALEQVVKDSLSLTTDSQTLNTNNNSDSLISF